MDAQTLSVDFEYLAAGGTKITAAERAASALALAQLAYDYKFAQALLWGKVLGAAGDYLVAKGLPAAARVDGVKLFVSDDRGVSWKELPAATEAEIELARRIGGLFSGSLAQVYKITETATAEEIIDPVAAAAAAAAAKPAKADGDGDGDGDADAAADADGDGDAAAPKGPAKVTTTATLREDRRLAALVAGIDAETSVVPRGAYLLDATQQLAKNGQFGGLSDSAAMSLASYCHLRPAQAAKRLSLLQRKHEGLLPHTDFLDRLSEDSPKGAWAVRHEPSQSAVTLRSLLWPGYSFYHVLGSNRFGSLYCGWGEKNVDVCFMLPA